MSSVSRLVSAVNRSPLWRRSVRVGPDVLFAPSFDRLLYLWAQKLRYARNPNLAFLRGCVQPGMHAVDVGANVGVHTHLLAHAVGPEGRVTAFEPDPGLFAALSDGLEANGLRHVEVHQLALGAASGRAPLMQGVFNSGDNRLLAAGGPSRRPTVEIGVKTLDDVVNGAPVHFIKIDVQGWEVSVLRGMERTIRENPALRLRVELWPYGLRAAGTSADALIDTLERFGFSLQFAADRGLSRTTDFAKLADREFWFTDLYAFRR